MATAFRYHDHYTCTATALARADQLVSKNGLRLTLVRRKVLEILLEQHRALGAYEVLEKLETRGWGKQPPVAYRALGFLVENGLAHRIQRLNAFTACQEDHPEGSVPVFMICQKCKMIAETGSDRLQLNLMSLAASVGFSAGQTTIEMFGLCELCSREAV